MNAISIIVISLGFSFAQASSQNASRTSPIVVSASPLQSFANQGGIWNHTDVKTQAATPSFQQDLNSASGMMTRTQGSPSVSVRGSTQSGRVLSLVDGIPLYSSTGVGSQNLLMPQENFERLQVYKTPASVFYGSSAMGGVLNFQSVELDRPRARVQINGYNSFGTQQKSGYLAAPLIKNKNHFLQVSTFASGDTGDFPFATPEQPALRRRGDNGSDLQRVQVKGRHKLGSIELEENIIAVQNRQRVPGSLFYTGLTETQTQAQLAALGVRTRDVPLGEMSFRTSGLFEHIRSADQYSVSNTNAQTYQQTLRYEMTEVETSPEFTLNWRTEQLKAGYAGNTQFSDNQPELGLRLLFPGGPEWPHWTVQTGARYLARFGKFVTAFGAFYNKDNDHAWGSYSEGFRAPTLTDRFASTTLFSGNGGLVPEYSRAIEVGYRRKLWGPTLYDQQGLFFTVTGFRTKYENLIEYRSQGLQLRPVNRGEALVKGIENELGYQGHVWRTSVATDFTESDDQQAGRELRIVPRQKHVVRGAYQWGAVESEVRYTYVSSYIDQRLTPTAGANEMSELGPWRTVDITLQTIGFANFQIQAGILNVFNEQRQLTFGYPEPGRVVYLSYQRDL